MSAPPRPPRDTTDWTTVITEGCPACGFTPPTRDALPARLRAAADTFAAALARPDAAERPAPLVWSPVEYACHVRDVCRTFGQRHAAMLATDGVRFADWDGEAAAIADAYHAQQPDRVADEVRRELDAAADRYARTDADAWGRRGVRGDGHPFTVESLAAYLLHEAEHHAHDTHRA